MPSLVKVGTDSCLFSKRTLALCLIEDIKKKSHLLKENEQNYGKLRFEETLLKTPANVFFLKNKNDIILMSSAYCAMNT